jgi:nicotinamide mononucleotide transporter
LETVFTIYNYKISYLEFFGSVFNFISIILATKTNWTNWVISIIAQICFFFLFWYNHLYANALLQIYYTYICVVSIFLWKKTEHDIDKGLRWLKNEQRLLLIFITIFSTISIGYVFNYFNSNTQPNLFLDVMITVLSIIGVNLLSLKYIETWIVWLIVDIICVVLFWYSNLYILSIEYILITGLALYGLKNWLKIKKQL